MPFILISRTPEQHNLNTKPVTSKTRSGSFRASRSIFAHIPFVPTVAYPLTLRNAEAYLVVPALRLYDRFKLRFALRTTQTDGLILFNPGPFTVDFLAFELSQGHLFVNFDMGSGAQRHGLLGTRVDDNQWHGIELTREDTERNILTLVIDQGTRMESRSDIKVLHGERSKNFNLADQLYIGGLPKSVILKWRERLRVVHGYQVRCVSGCFANFSVNDQPAQDLLKLAKEMAINRTGSVHLFNDEDIVPGCLDRPSGAPQCPVQTTSQRLHEAGMNVTLPKSSNNVYCMNDGICLLLWSSLKCSCELTSFQGARCSQTGTTQSFGITPANARPVSTPSLLKTSDSMNSSASAASIGYLRLTYTDHVRNTYQEEFVLGVQTVRPTLSVDGKTPARKSDEIETLLYVTNTAQTGDFLHLYLVRLWVRFDSNGLLDVFCVHLPNLSCVNIDQGGRYGKQFNGQETIWLGHAPSLNRTDFYQGFMSGVYYNGILLSDIAAGQTYLPFIHVTRYANVEHVNNFEAALSPASPFRSYNTQADAQSSQHNAHSATSGIVPGDISPNSVLSDFATDVNVDDKPRGRSNINDQVNIWLLVCLAGAGCIMLVSLTFLAYRFHFKQLPCCQPNRNARRAHKWSPVRRSSRCTLHSNDTLPHPVPRFQDGDPCSPVLIPLARSDISKHGSGQLSGSMIEAIGSSYNPTVALMMPNPLMTENGRKSACAVSATCCPLHLQAVPTSVVYLDSNSLVTTAMMYQPWERCQRPTEDRASSISPYSTSSSPVADLTKPVLETQIAAAKLVTEVEVSGTLQSHRSISETEPT
ncbi:unnamed protein product [Echinostoma caproni]|uniref:LAM_G_DOMAIN domain-containing protein n=1 Tax=Echinostoma caproni TaxID=27848 RepID=A0A183A5T3_9TREM|nr:unnamed protein product [Echinostoma caproni]